jgi:periplasmic divalent cation tolerance protein
MKMQLSHKNRACNRSRIWQSLNMTGYISVYIAVASAEEAESIAKALVESHLAGCVNILPGVRSIYRWQGHIEASEEVILIAKSRNELFWQLEQKVKNLSSYDCPGIVAWPIVAGHEPYLEWLGEELNAK